MPSLRNLLIVVCTSIACTSAPAALVDLGNTVKDDVTNLIWLKDWDQLGSRNWYDHNAAIDALDFAGSSDWRLPTIDEYFSLWAHAGSTTSGLQAHFDDVADPGNAVTNSHWSSTPAPPAPFTGYFFVFRRGVNAQQTEFVARTSQDGSDPRFYATAVREAGNDQPVPEPQTLALAIAALAAMGMWRRSGRQTRSNDSTRQSVPTIAAR